MRFYKIKIQKMNVMTEQNIATLSKEADKLKELVEKEIKLVQDDRD